MELETKKVEEAIKFFEWATSSDIKNLSSDLILPHFLL
jgi:hypothetical protein